MINVKMQKLNVYDDRIKWVDVSKGIAILLVIWGHSINSGGSCLEKILRGLIFSFHMPLFFFLSGVTNKKPKNYEDFYIKTEKIFRKLVLPAVLIFGLRIIFELINGSVNNSLIEYVKIKINALVYGSGVPVYVNGAKIDSFGMMWFLIVLFEVRTIYNYICLRVKSKFVFKIIIFAFAGVLIGKIQFLPISLDIAFAVLVFYALGDLYKKNNGRIYLELVVSFLIWITLFLFIYFFYNDYLELTYRRYPVFPLCFIVSIAGSLFVVGLSKLIENTFLLGPLTWLGKKSIFLFAVHAMDYLYDYIWMRTTNDYLNGIIRVIFDIVVCLIIVNFVNITKKSVVM